MFYNHPGPYFHLSYPRNCRMQPYNFMPPSLKNPPTTALGRSKSIRVAIVDPSYVPYGDIMPDSNLDPDLVNCPDSQILTRTNGQERAGELLAILRMQGSSNSINHNAVSSMAKSIHNSKSMTNSTSSSNSPSPSSSSSPSHSSNRNSSNKSSAFKTNSNGSGHTFGGSRTGENSLSLLHASLHPKPDSLCRTDNKDNSNNNKKNNSNMSRHIMQSHFAPRQNQNQQPPPGNPMPPAANPLSINIKNNEGAHDDTLICKKGERQAPCTSTLHDIQASLGPSSPSSSSSVMSVLLDEMQLLKAQIMQATLVLTHVVQTMTVPSPAALLDVVSKKGLLLGKDIARDEGCTCARLHIQQGRAKQSHSHNHGLHFLVAYYSPDPWEFQNRVIRQIACMQQELNVLRQESLEAQKRATIQQRKEVMEWERSRDIEWVELNERMHNVFLVADDNEKNGSEHYRRPFKKDPRSDDSGEEEGKWVRENESKSLLTKSDKESEETWKANAATIHNTWAGAVTPLAGGPLFPSKVRDDEGFGREVFWAGDYSSSQFSPISPHSKEE